MAYILQQIFVGCAWVWVLRVIWHEVREVMREEKDK